MFLKTLRIYLFQYISTISMQTLLFSEKMGTNMFTTKLYIEKDESRVFK